MENGIDVDVKTVLEMKDLSNYVGVDFEKYFGKLDIEDDGYKTVVLRRFYMEFKCVHCNINITNIEKV